MLFARYAWRATISHTPEVTRDGGDAVIARVDAAVDPVAAVVVALRLIDDRDGRGHRVVPSVARRFGRKVARTQSHVVHSSADTVLKGRIAAHLSQGVGHLTAGVQPDHGGNGALSIKNTELVHSSTHLGMDDTVKVQRVVQRQALRLKLNRRLRMLVGAGDQRMYRRHLLDGPHVLKHGVDCER